MKPKTLLFENINKIGKPLAKLIRKKITDIKNEREDITINSAYIKKENKGVT